MAKQNKGKNKKATKVARASLASVFNNSDPAEVSSLMSPGEHVARLDDVQIVAKGKQRTVRILYVGIEGEEEGKKISQNYTLIDADGNPGSGAGFLKRDLALLGKEDLEFDSDSELEEFLEGLVKEELSVVLNVKQNGQYTNCYLQGLAEDGEELEDDEDEDEEEVIDVEDEDEDESEDEDEDESESEDEDELEEESEDEDEEESEDEDEEEEEEEDEDAGGDYTRKEIMKMSKKMLTDVIEAEDLKINPKKIASLATLREKVAKALGL